MKRLGWILSILLICWGGLGATARASEGTGGRSSTSANWTAEPNQTNADFGNSVGSAGDVNGDGDDDVIVGAAGYDNRLEDEGRAFVFHGSAAGLSQTPSWTATANERYAAFGYSVASAGDVNGDGYDDVIVGATFYAADRGKAFVFHGSAQGLNRTPDWKAESNQDEALFSHVAGAGDLNGDGYDDVIVGAGGYTNGQYQEGRAFVFHGSAAGLSLAPDWKTESNQELAFLGNSVAGAGDVNGDGQDDVIVGAPGYDHGQTDEGKASVFHGSAGGLSHPPNWTAEPNQESSYLGGSVGSAGDVNGDGYDDVIVTGVHNNKGPFVFHGSAEGLSHTPNWKG